MSQNTLKTFLSTIGKIADETIRTDLFEIEVIETGGTIINPERSGPTHCTHLCEIHLHDIYMTGTTMPEAMMKWERCANQNLPHDTKGAYA